MLAMGPHVCSTYLCCTDQQTNRFVNLQPMQHSLRSVKKGGGGGRAEGHMVHRGGPKRKLVALCQFNISGETTASHNKINNLGSCSEAAAGLGVMGRECGNVRSC